MLAILQYIAPLRHADNDQYSEKLIIINGYAAVVGGMALCSSLNHIAVVMHLHCGFHFPLTKLAILVSLLLCKIIRSCTELL